MNKNISREFEKNYDLYSKENYWKNPDVLFNRCFEYVNNEDLLLDISIGTGLSTEPFKKAGLCVYGLDNSEHMLEICAEKKIADERQLHDITHPPSPYINQFFDCIIVCGIFLLTGFIEPLFFRNKTTIKKMAFLLLPLISMNQVIPRNILTQK